MGRTQGVAAAVRSGLFSQDMDQTANHRRHVTLRALIASKRCRIRDCEAWHDYKGGKMTIEPPAVDTAAETARIVSCKLDALEAGRVRFVS